MDTTNPLIINQFEKIYNEEYSIIQKINDSENDLNLKITNTKKIKKVGIGENNIYLFGPCILSGQVNFNKDKLINILYDKVNEKYPDKYSIKAIFLLQYDFANLWKIYNSLSIRDKDIVIFLGQSFKDICKDFSITTSVDLDLLELFNKRSDNEIWFSDIPVHTTGIANRAIAEELMKSIIEPKINKINFTSEAQCLQQGRALLSQKEILNLQIYIEGIKKMRFNTSEHDSVGAIVMNCNPMTLEHMYLIEYAKSKVDYFIFLWLKKINHILGLMIGMK